MKTYQNSRKQIRDAVRLADTYKKQNKERKLWKLWKRLIIIFLLLSGGFSASAQYLSLDNLLSMVYFTADSINEYLVSKDKKWADVGMVDYDTQTFDDNIHFEDIPHSHSRELLWRYDTQRYTKESQAWVQAVFIEDENYQQKNHIGYSTLFREHYDLIKNKILTSGMVQGKTTDMENGFYTFYKGTKYTITTGVIRTRGENTVYMFLIREKRKRQRADSYIKELF